MLKKLLIGLVVIVAIGGFILYQRMGSIVKSGAETYGSEALTVSLSLDDVSLSPFTGSAGVSGLAIGQPEGFRAPDFPEGPMLAVGDFKMKVDTDTLFNPHVIVESINIDSPVIDVRMIGKKSNLQALADKLATGGSSSQSNITLTVREFTLTNPRIIVSAKDGPVPLDENIQLADVRLTDIGTDEKGLSPSELARHLMAVIEPQVTKALVKAGVEKQLQGVLDKNKDKIKDKLGGLIGGITGKKETTEEDGN